MVDVIVSSAGGIEEDFIKVGQMRLLLSNTDIFAEHHLFYNAPEVPHHLASLLREVQQLCLPNDF